MRQSLKKKKNCEKVFKEYVGFLQRRRSRRDRDGDRDRDEKASSREGEELAHLIVVTGKSRIHRVGQVGGLETWVNAVILRQNFFSSGKPGFILKAFNCLDEAYLHYRWLSLLPKINLLLQNTVTAIPWISVCLYNWLLDPGQVERKIQVGAL